MSKATAEELLEQSLVYERAWSRVINMLGKIRVEKEKDHKEKRRLGEEPDESYQIVCDGLVSLADDLREYADKLYEEQRKRRVPFNPAYVNLLNAIVTKAAEDYEYALSGDQNENEIKAIEEFAEILGVRAVHIMAKLRKNRDEFSRVAQRDAKAVIEETNRNRKRGVALENNTHKCPNCGGSLFTTKMYGSNRICCTKCYFFEVVKKDGK